MRTNRIGLAGIGSVVIGIIFVLYSFSFVADVMERK
jgi:hypothetical protein